jgi:hypothetical protein
MTDGFIKIIHALKKDLGMTEEKLLGDIIHPLDVGQPWMGKGTYELYHAIGKCVQNDGPSIFLEIGVRFGYSLRSLCKGAYHVGKIYGFDNEYDLSGSLEIARSNLIYWSSVLELIKLDTQTASFLPVDKLVDLAHIDGWHTEDGCYHDCCLVKPHMKKGGYILVDDVNAEQVKAGADRFCDENNLTPFLIECHTGMYLIEWRGD